MYVCTYISLSNIPPSSPWMFFIIKRFVVSSNLWLSWNLCGLFSQ